VVLALGLAAAGLLTITHSSFLYLLYVALSMLIGMVAASTLIWMLYAWRTPDSLAASSLPADGRAAAHSFSLIVPARHEEAVLETTLSRLVCSDHPNFEILVVVGADDPGTREVAERMADRHPERVRVIVDSSWPKSKPKALNAALPHCSGAVTGIFDAEDDVHPALLRRVDQCFQTTDADIVQAGVQLMNFRSRWFTVHNVLEYYFWFRSRLHVHARQGFIPLGGNTVFIRTSILRAVGGWADCLAEDCEIGVRLSALGARTAVFYEPELVTREECPPTVGAFVRQRTRWNQGYLQTLARGYWRRLPLRQRVLGFYILASPYVMALAWLMIPAAIATAVVVKAPIEITLLSFLPLLPMLAMLVAEGAGLAEFCRAYREQPSLLDYCRLVLGLLAYQFLLAYAAVRAVARQARGVQGWEKTVHLGQHLGQPADAAAKSETAVSKTAPGVAIGKTVPEATAYRSALIPQAPRLPTEPRALAEDVVGSLAPAPAARPVESQRPYQYAAAGVAADTAQLGNGHAELPAKTIEHLFGVVGGPPLWARLDGEAPRAAAPLSPPPRLTPSGSRLPKSGGSLLMFLPAIDVMRPARLITPDLDRLRSGAIGQRCHQGVASGSSGSNNGRIKGRALVLIGLNDSKVVLTDRRHECGVIAHIPLLYRVPEAVRPAAGGIRIRNLIGQVVAEDLIFGQQTGAGILA
jgi:cellulose synthase/poly-beta-1,6-N-acetylglucosamine synthase-like glycosyltransferase